MCSWSRFQSIWKITYCLKSKQAVNYFVFHENTNKKSQLRKHKQVLLRTVSTDWPKYWDTFSTSTVLFRTTTWCYRKLHLIIWRHPWKATEIITNKYVYLYWKSQKRTFCSECFLNCFFFHTFLMTKDLVLRLNLHMFVV